MLLSTFSLSLSLSPPPHSLLLLACNHTHAAQCTDCNSAIDHLIDAFTNSVSEYLTGDSVDSNLPSLQHRSGGPGGGGSGHGGGGKLGLSASGLKGFSKSQDNLAKFGSVVDLTQHFNDPSESEITFSHSLKKIACRIHPDTFNYIKYITYQLLYTAACHLNYKCQEFHLLKQ